ncbi:MAG TPA: MlaD family protein [Lacunisphaera sp.]|nr:MlaD family protein [Lacunisphaera sp.]
MNPLLQPHEASQRAVRRARQSVALTLVAVFALGGYLGWKEGYFTPVERFHFEAPSSKSLSKGMPVHLSGFKIGQVTSVELMADRTVRVELAVYRRFLDFIRTDSEVRLEAGMPIGDPSLEIAGGPTRADIAAPGSQLRYRGQPQLFDQLGGVVEQVEPMIGNINALLTQARQPAGELQVSLRNLATATTQLQAWMPGFLERTDATLASFKQTAGSAHAVMEPLTRTDGDLQSTLRELRSATAELHAALPPLLADLKALSASLRTTATNLEPAVAQLAPKLPGLAEQGRRTATGAGEIVDAVKELPLIRGKVNQPAPQPLLPTTPP